MVSATSSAAGAGRDRFKKKREAEAIEESSGLVEVGTASEVEREGLEAARAHAELAQHVIRDQEDAAAVDAAGEADADGLLFGNPLEPAGDFVGEGGDVGAADDVEIGGQRAHGRSKEAGIDRVRIGATDELQFHDVVGGDHAGVAGMELRVEAFGLQPVVDGVDARSDDQGRAFRALGEEVAHGAVEGACHAHGLARAGEQGEGSLDVANGLGRLLEQEAAGVLDGHVVDLVGFGGGQIDYPFDILGEYICHAVYLEGPVYSAGRAAGIMSVREQRLPVVDTGAGKRVGVGASRSICSRAI